MYPETIELLIDGAWCQGSDGKSEPLINPATEEVLATVPHATEADLDRALAASLKGFKLWKTMTAMQRWAIMDKAADLIEQRKDTIARILTMENGNTFRGKIFVDATYEGDLLAMAKVSYTFGREANAQYGETINGVQYHNGHNFTKPVDPYVIEGDPKSGLLLLISPAPPRKAGEGDKLLQAYNFRMYLTNAADRVAFPKPKNYDASKYALLPRYLKVNPKLAVVA